MLALVLGTYVCPAAAQPQPRRTVLVVHWSPEEFPINPPRDAAIREVLLAPSEVPIDYFAEYLESDRFEEPGASQALRDYIQQKYQGRQIDVVIAVTDVALQFVPHRDLSHHATRDAARPSQAAPESRQSCAPV